MNIRFIYITTIIFILNILCCIGLDSGTPYNVFEIPKCYGDSLVKIRAYNNISNDKYSFDGCSKTSCVQCKDNEELWKCSCIDGKALNITLNTADDLNNEYDITIEYYIEPIEVLLENETSDTEPTQADIENSNKKRVETITNLEFGAVEKKPPKEPIKWPSLGEGGLMYIFFLIGGILLFILVVGVMLFKWLMKEGESQYSSPSTYSSRPKVSPSTKKKKEMTDEEILELIRNNTK